MLTNQQTKDLLVALKNALESIDTHLAANSPQPVKDAVTVLGRIKREIDAAPPVQEQIAGQLNQDPPPARGGAGVG